MASKPAEAATIEAPAAAPAEAAAAAPAAVASEAAATDTKTESTPSLLASADAGKRDDPAKPADTPAKPADEASAAKPADGAAPAEKPADAKPEDAKPAEAATEAKPDAAKDALAEPPPAPSYGDLKLPEGFKLDGDKLKEFDSVLGTFETGAKADHAQVESLRQNLVNFYHSEVQRIGEQVSKHQVDVWNRLNETRINELKSDPQYGGNRIDTTLGTAKHIIEQFGGSKAEQEQLLSELDNGGVSNSKRFIALLNRVYDRIREPEPVPPNPPIPPQGSKEPGKRGWYDPEGASAVRV